MKPGLLFTWPLSRYRNNIACVFQGRRLTYAEMDALINRISRGLLSIGLHKGCKVGVLMNNSIESAAMLFAIPRAGLTYVSLNTRHSAREHAAILNNAEIDALVLDEKFISLLDPMLPKIPSLKITIVAGKAPSGKTNLEEIIEQQPATHPEMEVDEDVDIERIQYTSGTTGRPKGAVWTYRIGYNVITNVLFNLDIPVGPGEVNLNIGPLTHAAGLMLMVYYCRGAKNVIMPGFNEKELLETIERERVTSLLLIPTMLYRLLLYPELESYDLGSIKRIWYGTAPMSPDRLKEGIRIFGAVFRQNYGMTEMAQPITFLEPEDHIIDGSKEQVKRLSSAGRPALGVEVRVLNEKGKEVRPGETGEIVIRADKLMKEYWKMPEETAEAIKDGWFYTRDLASVDKEGFIYILDRKSDMIISGGFNIYPREVEEALMSHPKVSESAVFGISDDIWGESVKAVVVLKKGAVAGEAELIEHCRSVIASYKKPGSIDFLKEIPKNLYGKIDRRSLKEMYRLGIRKKVK